MKLLGDNIYVTNIVEVIRTPGKQSKFLRLLPSFGAHWSYFPFESLQAKVAERKRDRQKPRKSEQ